MVEKYLLDKLRKYANLFVHSFKLGVALTGHEENLPLVEVALVEKETHGAIPLLVAMNVGGEIRRGFVLLTIIDDRIRIQAMPFDPERVSEVLQSDRAEEFLLEVLACSYDIYDADFGIKFLEYEGKREPILVAQNDLLKDYFTYDEFEEELFGVLAAIVNLYKRLVKKGFQPKLYYREHSVEEVEKGDMKKPEDLRMFIRAFSRRSSLCVQRRPAPCCSRRSLQA